jgi:hypothetical protein
MAYGFVSHNEAWGEDWTAHIQNLTLGGHEGYVIIKAQTLAAGLSAALNGIVAPADLLVVSHELIEYGIDLLVRKNQDKGIGLKMTTAAVERSNDFPLLLVSTFGPSLTSIGIPLEDATAIIVGAENQYRFTMEMYGTILATPDDEQTMDLLVQFLLPQAQSYFASRGIILPPEIDLAQVIHDALTASMQLCAADYYKELTRTRSHTVSQMAVNGILYRGMLAANR